MAKFPANVLKLFSRILTTIENGYAYFEVTFKTTFDSNKHFWEGLAIAGEQKYFHSSWVLLDTAGDQALLVIYTVFEQLYMQFLNKCL